MRYEVQIRTVNHWVNCWYDDGESVTFASKTAAQAALDEHLGDCQHAVESGYMNSPPDLTEYRIWRLIT